MSEQNLFDVAEHLEDRIQKACTETRLKLQPEFSAIVARMLSEGQHVPARMRNLEATLTDEAIEARFDNMPV